MSADLANDISAGQDEIRLLAESAQAFAKRRLAVADLRKTEEAIDRTLWVEMAEMGWMSIAVSEADGGFGLGPNALAGLMPVLGASLLRQPVAACGIGTGRMLSSLPAGGLRDDLLRRHMAGELIAGVICDGEGGCPSLEGVPAGDGVRVTGRARYLIPGEAADGWLVPIPSGTAAGIYWLPADSGGATCDRELRADGGFACHLNLDTALPAGARLCDGDEVEAIVAEARDWVLLATAAELLGLMREALARTGDYLKTRQQFGRVIGSFQALQHRAADLLLQQELTAAVLDHALAEIAATPTPAMRARAACRAKARASSAALRITREAIQLHGGIGFTQEHEIGLFLKRALVLSAWLGNAETQARRFGALARQG